VKLLLDTHALLWWVADDPRLSRAARSAVAAQQAEVAVSAATLWEISIKRSRGKLEVGPEELRAALDDAQFRRLPIDFDHAWEAGALPLHHADPFDRVLVAQARVEGMTIITRDPAITRYDVHVLAA
jgi:PIN domain nuclease of toxin-antitoxin system